jgi:uncharacterized membrane protein YagU involved in acid resistance
MNGPIIHALKGSLAGIAATVPMTIAMAAMHKLLPGHEQYPLPPRLITENALEKADADGTLPEEHEDGLALVNHFAYGAAMGAVYSLGLYAARTRPAAASGVAFGLGVWAASYQAILPVAGLFPPPEAEPARRNALMITSHIVWGAALGLALQAADGKGENQNGK